MSEFQAVNSTLSEAFPFLGNSQEVTTPTTPKPLNSSTSDGQRYHTINESSPNTPTRSDFGGVSGQRPLPSSPFTHAITSPNSDGETYSNGSLVREHLQYSASSGATLDVEMGDSDEELDCSDSESAGGDNGRHSKKKKGQRFFCTDYPPCTLSFTRSEHLARHIRKHTGERPFQCHCSRRFSRLDNLRQHAQTVHVNEEIPNDSLAATGTRFQRQIRTDRVRQTGSRSRASTVGSQSGHVRGHARNLSASSIGSSTSSVNIREDRRRPPPLIVANESHPHARHSLDTFRSPPDSPAGGRETSYRIYNTQSPGGFSTPASATFSTGQTSPRFPAGFQSPGSNSSWDSNTPSRRLSVPSGISPFYSSQHTVPPPYFAHVASSSNSVYSGNSSILASPTRSVFSHDRDVASRAAQDAEWKRRTWHPESRSTLQSSLTNSPSAYLNSSMKRPLFGHQAQSSLGSRLPGIESFDHMVGHLATPPRRAQDSLLENVQSRNSGPNTSNEWTSNTTLHHRRGVSGWDMSLHQNLTRLDITSLTPPSEGLGSGQRTSDTGHRHSGSYEPISEITSELHRSCGSVSIPEFQGTPSQSLSQDDASVSPTTPRRAKRQGWYNGQPNVHAAVMAHRTSPEDSSSSEGIPTPSTSSIGDYNPSIVHSNGWVESDHGLRAEEHASQMNPSSGTNEHTKDYPIASSPQDAIVIDARPDHRKNDADMLKLEALAAVATSGKE